MISYTLLLLVTIFFGLISVNVGYIGRKNYVTSAEEKMNLLEKDKELIILLNSYAVELQDKINQLQKIANEFRASLEEAKGREVEYLSNPLNSLSLLRQMHEDWEPVEKLIRQPVGQGQIASIEKLRNDLPLQDDLDEATHALIRIVHSYDLEPKDVARGLVDGVQYSGNLSASDCYTLAKSSFMAGRYQIATKWLRLAKNLFNNMPRKYNEVIGLTNIKINLLLARSLIANGSLSTAREILIKDTMFGEAGNRLAQHFYENPPHPTLNLETWESEGVFDGLCRSVSRRQTNESKITRLHCRYNTTTSPFLKLAPFRMEELSLDPYIVLYHNVLNDDDMERLVRMSEPFLERTTVFRVDNRIEQLAPSRTADGAWIPRKDAKPEDRQLFRRIRQRVGDITGLNVHGDRDIQFMKYGFGGHFEPHNDYFDSKTSYVETVGDRIATVLFYLNTVEHGGATAFSKINLAVPTQKGSALFWHNLHGESYDYDERTFHGACPLISGTKLVMTRWIHELDQMFLLPTMLPPRSRNFSKIFSNKT
ncbi:prolyl 4-hydroxylase subunit alpha-2 [Drosophila rhopaloa]|uniref:procollagen-proline 4-dioxygenase n=1 Tax=Drosophila rhopaloa TaxID=1041015 RepID=A0A6P4EIP4_DRORH|nr:prolyl 4-hydroxylase subunit alpha-2 [Drosophila rhopaloa]